MNRPEPLYTAQNCRFAYELYWGLSVFWRTAVHDDDWYDELTRRLEPDGIRLLGHRFAKPGVSQFRISTRPETAPVMIVQRVKGRLQHLVRDRWPKAFRGNYGIRSFGEVTREVIEHYVASQLQHHRMADDRVNQVLAGLQIAQPEVDLSQPQRTSHGIYWYNLHLVLVHDERWADVSPERLQQVQETILKVSRAKGHLLSRGAILADHVHFALGCPLEASPAETTLSYLNNLAFVYEMKPVFQFGACLGTFGEYDWGAVSGDEPRGGTARR